MFVNPPTKDIWYDSFRHPNSICLHCSNSPSQFASSSTLQDFPSKHKKIRTGSPKPDSSQLGWKLPSLEVKMCLKGVQSHRKSKESNTMLIPSFHLSANNWNSFHWSKSSHTRRCVSYSVITCLLVWRSSYMYKGISKRCGVTGVYSRSSEIRTDLLLRLLKGLEMFFETPFTLGLWVCGHALPRLVTAPTASKSQWCICLPNWNLSTFNIHLFTSIE